jgi:hypothetical protein
VVGHAFIGYPNGAPGGVTSPGDGVIGFAQRMLGASGTARVAGNQLP